MALETELKFIGVDFADLRQRLRGLGAVRLDRYFERNAVFDRPDRSLGKNDVLLRLRQARKAVLTLKFLPDTPCPEDVKVREEIQTVVEDYDAMWAILENLGYAPVFFYEKIREKWRRGDCVLCLDTLPFGDFLEIEGERDALMDLAGRLGLSMASSCVSNYRTLHIEHRERAGLPFEESFVFSDAQRAAHLAELELLDQGS